MIFSSYRGLELESKKHLEGVFRLRGEKNMKKFLCIQLLFCLTTFGILLITLSISTASLVHSSNGITYEYPSEIPENANSITIKFLNINPSLENSIWVEGATSYCPDYLSEILDAREVAGSSPKVYFVEKTIRASDFALPCIFHADHTKIGNPKPLLHRVKLKYNGNEFETPGYTVELQEVPSCENFYVYPYDVFALDEIDDVFIKAADLTPGAIYGIAVYKAFADFHIKLKAGLRPNGSNEIILRMSEFLNTGHSEGHYEARLIEKGLFICSYSFELRTYIPPGPRPTPGPSPTPPISADYKPCEPIKKQWEEEKKAKYKEEYDNCLECTSPSDPNKEAGVWTALGCIAVQPADFIKTLIRIGFGIGGGIAFLFMVMGVIKILTSQGNPETLNDGRGMITSAVAGLLLIIFSVIVLKIIGVDILELPGFKH